MPTVDFLITDELLNLGSCVLWIIVLNEFVSIQIQFSINDTSVFSSMSTLATVSIHLSKMQIPDLPLLLMTAHTCTYISHVFQSGFVPGPKI